MKKKHNYSKDRSFESQLVSYLIWAIVIIAGIYGASQALLWLQTVIAQIMSGLGG